MSRLKCLAVPGLYHHATATYCTDLIKIQTAFRPGFAKNHVHVTEYSFISEVGKARSSIQLDKDGVSIHL